jgi:hypothetical protein
MCLFGPLNPKKAVSNTKHQTNTELQMWDVGCEIHHPFPGFFVSHLISHITIQIFVYDEVGDKRTCPQEQ